MKIALLSFSFVPHTGGAETFAYNLSCHLAARSHQVHVFVPRFAFSNYCKLGIESAFSIHPIFFQEVRFSTYLPLALALSLKLRQLTDRYDIWQVIGAYPAGYIARSLSTTVPVVLRSHGKDIQMAAEIGYGDRLHPARASRIKTTLSSMARVVALNQALSTCYAELGVPQRFIVEIPNGIEIERFTGKLDRRRVRRELGIGDDEALILSVGRYHRKKGYELIPPAARYLTERGHKIRWLVVGRGTGQIAPLVQHAGAGSTVILKEQIGADKPGTESLQLRVPADNLIALYRSADIFVLPSLVEGLSNVLLEAMAAGLPVVASDCPGNRDVIVHEYNGLLAETADPRSLALSIERIMRDAVLKAALVSNAGRTIKGYDWPNVAGAYEQLYRQLIAERQ